MFDLDNYLADPLAPMPREKFAYRMQDGTLVKFSTFNPMRGQPQSEGQVITFLEPDIITHSPEFYGVFTPVDILPDDPIYKMFHLENQREDAPKILCYRGVVQEVIELTGVFTPETSEEIINLTFANETLTASVLAWIFTQVFKFNQDV